jgi:hypothetical protein
VNANPRFGAWVIALLTGLGLIVTWPSPGRADSPFAAVDARASADAFRLGVAVRKFLIVENFVDGGGPTAQAQLTSVGSAAFAALPDPGGFVINYNTVVGLATGSGLPFNYPFFAAAQYPGSPKSEVADPSGSYRVAANTAADGAEALAQTRPTAGDVAISGAAAKSSVKLEGDRITATSETIADAVSLSNGALKLSGVVSRSVTTRQAGQSEPATETSLTVDLITAGDQRIRYGPKGFEFLGTPVPVPSDAVAGSLKEALKPVGLSLEVVRPETVTGGAKAAVLEIRQAAPLPAGQSDVVLRLGGATSSIAAEDTVPVPDLTTPAPTSPTPVPTEVSNATDPAPSAVVADTASITEPVGGADLSGSPRFAASPASPGPAGSPGSYPAGVSAPTSVPAAESVTSSPDTPPQVPLQNAAPPRLAGQRRSVVGPYSALAAAGLAIVLLSAAWANRVAAKALWVNP